MEFLAKNWIYIILVIVLIFISFILSKILGDGTPTGGCCGGYIPKDLNVEKSKDDECKKNL